MTPGPEDDQPGDAAAGTKEAAGVDETAATGADEAAAAEAAAPPLEQADSAASPPPKEEAAGAPPGAADPAGVPPPGDEVAAAGTHEAAVAPPDAPDPAAAPTPEDDIEDEAILACFDEMQHEFRIFMDSVLHFLGDHPKLRVSGREIVHSYKSRLKDREHLRAKLQRKRAEGKPISAANLFDRVTDLAGVRIMHLFQEHFAKIDEVIRVKVDAGDWVLGERATAYTWDPEAAEFFGKFDLEVVQKPTSYTSVHYLIRPRADSPLCCEVQVRTLFEEIWGETDHQINYPEPTESLACREQIKVLSKIVGAGSRLLDSLHRVHQDFVGAEKG